MAYSEMSAEHQALLATLNSQRGHVLGILEGLPEHELRRPVLPTGWNCLGLVQHLALDVERVWFRALVAGQDVDLVAGGAWRVDPDLPADAVLELYKHETELADAIIAGTPLDAEPARWTPDLVGDLPIRNVRENILHVITETACHAGHLDAVRELIDGKTWLIFD